MHGKLNCLNLGKNPFVVGALLLQSREELLKDFAALLHLVSNNRRMHNISWNLFKLSILMPIPPLNMQKFMELFDISQKTYCYHVGSGILLQSNQNLRQTFC